MPSQLCVHFMHLVKITHKNEENGYPYRTMTAAALLNESLRLEFWLN
jgi:hypothetical protein